MRLFLAAVGWFVIGRVGVEVGMSIKDGLGLEVVVGGGVRIADGIEDALRVGSNVGDGVGAKVGNNVGGRVPVGRMLGDRVGNDVGGEGEVPPIVELPKTSKREKRPLAP